MRTSSFAAALVLMMVKGVVAPSAYDESLVKRFASWSKFLSARNFQALFLPDALPISRMNMTQLVIRAGRYLNILIDRHQEFQQFVRMLRSHLDAPLTLGLMRAFLSIPGFPQDVQLAQPMYQRIVLFFIERPGIDFNVTTMYTSYSTVSVVEKPYQEGADIQFLKVLDTKNLLALRIPSRPQVHHLVGLRRC